MITQQFYTKQAQQEFAVAWDKRAFRGREALVGQKQGTTPKRLVQFRLDDPNHLLYHDEPIYRNGDIVGRTSSGMWSYEEDRCLAMGYLTNPSGVTKEWIEDGTFEIEVATKKISSTASLRSFYDPTNQRVRM